MASSFLALAGRPWIISNLSFAQSHGNHLIPKSNASAQVRLFSGKKIPLPRLPRLLFKTHLKGQSRRLEGDETMLTTSRPLCASNCVAREKESWGVSRPWTNLFHLVMFKQKWCLHSFRPDTCSKNQATSLSSNPHASQTHSFSSSMPGSALTPASSQRTRTHPLSMLAEVMILLAHCPRAWETGARALDSKAASVCKLLKTLYHGHLVCGRKTFLVFHRVALWIK